MSVTMGSSAARQNDGEKCCSAASAGVAPTGALRAVAADEAPLTPLLQLPHDVLASLQAAAADCAAQAAGFSPDAAAAGLLVADQLRALFLPLARGLDAVPSAGALPPTAPHAAAAGNAHLTLLQLPAEVLILVFDRLDTQSLARVAATCSELCHHKPRPMTPVEEVLRHRAAARGRVCPARLPQEFSSWSAHLAWLECRRDEAWAPVAAGFTQSLFVADGGQIRSCGAETAYWPGVLGLGELDGEARVVPTPDPLPSMWNVRIRSVSAGDAFSAAVSAEGSVYTWGNGAALGHGGEAWEQRSLVPKQVQALPAHGVLSVAAGTGHVFSWGWDVYGQCGHWSSIHSRLQPRRVEALTGVRARSASAGTKHSLVVTEEGALYSFGRGTEGQLGRGIVDESSTPEMVDALLHVRIAAAAAGHLHSLALAADGRVYSWGSNAHGELGLGGDVDLMAGPWCVEAVSGMQVCSVAASASASSYAVTKYGALFTWGSGENGQLGHGDTADELAPRRVDALYFQGDWVVAVAAGSAHSLAVTRDGGVFGWGVADGLGLPHAQTVSVQRPDAAEEDDEEDGSQLCVLSPHRYPHLACAPRG